MPASQDSLAKGFSFQENMLLYALLMGFLAHMVAFQFYPLVKFFFSTAITCFHAFTSYKEKGGIFKMYFCLVLYNLSSLDKSDNIKSRVFSPNYTQAQNTTNIILTTHLQKIKRKVK